MNVKALIAILMVLFLALPLQVSSQPNLKDALSSTLITSTIYSGAYSPYRTYKISSEIAATVQNINFREGDIIPAGELLLELDASLEKKQLNNYVAFKKAILKEKALLAKSVAINKKNYDRFYNLYKNGQVSEQTLENKKLALITAQDALIRLQKEQIQIENSIATLKNTIRKARLKFDKDLYLSQLVVERFEYVTPGKMIAKLMDISKARITLVVPPDLFKILKPILHKKGIMKILVSSGQDQWIDADVSFEKVKLDTAEDYLYSYSFDIILDPLPNFLWGEVIKVDIGPLINQSKTEKSK